MTSVDGSKEPATERNLGRGVLCSVFLLDGGKFEVTVPKKCKGCVLLEEVYKHVNLLEKHYFSLSYTDTQDFKFWLDPDKRINKQLRNSPWHFNFEVKFYPPNPLALQEDITRYQLCLQLRRDLVSSRLPCTSLSLAVLGSYTAQSELGDWEVGHGEGGEYLQKLQLAPNQTEELLEKVAHIHLQHKGQTPADAEADFLENCKKLALYGVQLHPARDASNNPVMIGVCASGLIVYRDSVRTHRFMWPKIMKISYKRKNFYLKSRPAEGQNLEQSFGFALTNRRLSKRLWKCAVEHHAFFRLKEPEKEKRGRLLLPRFGPRFRYSGRTQYQTQQHTAQVDRRQPLFERAASARPVAGRSCSAEKAEDSHLDKGVEDESELVRDAAGRKMHKTTTTTTTTTRFVVDEVEHVAAAPCEEGQMSECAAAEEPNRDETCEALIQPSVQQGETCELEQAEASSERMEKKLSLSSVATENIDYEKELRQAILTVTGMSEEVTVDEIHFKTAQQVQEQ